MTQSIIVQFTSTQIRDFVAATAKKLGVLDALKIFPGIQVASGRIYVNEFLPAAVNELLRKAKAKAEEAGYKYTWVKNECIFMRKNDDTKAITIVTESDLSQII